MTAPYSPPPRQSWRAHAREIATERLGLKAIALVLAVLLWLVVSARRQTEGYVRVQVTGQLDSSPVPIAGTTPLRALVAGRAADLVKLAADPPVVRHGVGGDTPDTVRLDVAPADVHLPPGLADRVRVVDVTPRTVTLRFRARTPLGGRVTPAARAESTVVARP